MIRDGCTSNLERELLDEPAPAFAAPVAQHQAEAVGNTCDCAAVGVAKCVSDRVVTDLLRGPTPDVAKLVTQSKVIAMAETVQASVGALFFKAEEPTRYFAVGAPALEDALVDHQVYYQDFWSNCRIG